MEAAPQLGAARRTARARLHAPEGEYPDRREPSTTQQQGVLNATGDSFAPVGGYNYLSIP